MRKNFLIGEGSFNQTRTISEDLFLNSEAGYLFPD